MFAVIDHAVTRRLAAAWIALAAGALGASALFALLLVLSRTPGVGDLFQGHDFFYPALVLHVNLSALIWFLAFAGAFWSAPWRRERRWPDGSPSCSARRARR